MAHWRVLSLVLVTSSAVAAAAYPVSAKLSLAPLADQSCLSLSRGSDCRVVQFAAGAFALAAERMFTPSAPGNLQLEVAIKTAELTPIEFDLYVRVRVLAPDGHLIDELVSFGSAPALDRSPDILERAERAAAEAAARDFERVYASSVSVGAWLVSNKVGPAEAVRVPARPDRLVTLAAGIGAVEGGGDDAVAISPGFHVAVANRWGFVQLGYSRYSSSFTGSPLGTGRTGDATLATNDIGLEAGAVFRLTQSLELRAGPGVHALFGDASTGVDPSANSSFSKFVPDLYASIATSFLAGRKGPRVSLGVEARGYFFTTVDLPQLLRTVPVANISAAVFIGLELPFNPNPENR